MADYDALESAQQVYHRTQNLYEDISNEARNMSHAAQSAHNSLDLINQASTKIINHVGYLNNELAKEKGFVNKYMQRIEEINKIETQLAKFKEITPQYGKPTRIKLPSPNPASFNFDALKAIKYSPITSLQANITYWDEMAVDFKTLDEQIEEAYLLCEQEINMLQDNNIKTISSKKTPAITTNKETE